jgi:hypothetical protein
MEIRTWEKRLNVRIFRPILQADLSTWKTVMLTLLAGAAEIAAAQISGGFRGCA